MFACLGELGMAQEERAGFGALPSPAISHTLLDFEEAPLTSLDRDPAWEAMHGLSKLR